MKGLRHLFFLLAPVALIAGVLVPEFAVTEGLGEANSFKYGLNVSSNDQGEIVACWFDCRDCGGSMLYSADYWAQGYSQYIDQNGFLGSGNIRLRNDGDFRRITNAVDVEVFNDGYILTFEAIEGELAVSLWETGSQLGGEPIVTYDIGIEIPVSFKQEFYVDSDGDNLCVLVREDFFRLFMRDGETIGDSIIINPSAEGKHVLMDSEGNFVITYMSGSNTYYRRYQREGEPLGQGVQIEDDAIVVGDPDGMLLSIWTADENIYTRPYSESDIPTLQANVIGQFESSTSHSITKGLSGGYLVSWTSHDTLYGRILDVSGAPLRDEFVAEVSEGNIGYVKAVAEEYDYRVIWSEWRGENNVYKSREVYASGLLGDYLQISDDEPGIHSTWGEPILTPQGDFFVVWRGSLTSDGFMLQGFTPQGVQKGQIWNTPDGYLSYPALGEDGNLYVGYKTREDLGENRVYKLWVQKYNLDGYPLGEAIKITETSPTRIKLASLTVYKNGDGIIVWEQTIPDVHSAYPQLWGQRFSAVTGRLIDEEFMIQDTFYPRGELKVYGFTDGGFIVGVTQTRDDHHYYCYMYDVNGILEREPFPADTIQVPNTVCNMACNDLDRFVVLWVDYFMGGVYLRVFDRNANQVGEIYKFHDPDFDNSLFWAGYSPAILMAPDGRFVVSWQTIDDVGNLNLWAQCFSRDNEPLNTPFQVNDPDCWEGCQQISGWRGVSAQNDRILFTWLDNRFHRGWDIMAKVTDWNVGGPAIEDNSPEINPLSLTTSLNQLSYDVPGETVLSLYSVDGRLIHREPVTGSGIAEFSELPQGVYFAQLRSKTGSKMGKLVILR